MILTVIPETTDAVIYLPSNAMPFLLLEGGLISQVTKRIRDPKSLGFLGVSHDQWILFLTAENAIEFGACQSTNPVESALQKKIAEYLGKLEGVRIGQHEGSHLH